MNYPAERLHRLFEAMEALLANPEGHRLDSARNMEECFGINIGDYVAAAMKLGMPFTHIVIPIHGIRDDGGWFEVFRRALSDKPYIEVRPGGYGYFHVAKFFSERARRRVFDRVVQTLRDGQGQNRVVSVVCHSFGTYCVTKAILENADIRLYRLVMCGSIVPRLFPWNNVPAALPPGRIINDCGNNDSWPIVAQRLCKLCGEPGLYGDTGRLGFAHDPVTDRWHDVDHGGFFTEDIATNYWAPFITQGKIIPSPVALKPPGPWLSLLAGRWP